MPHGWACAERTLIFQTCDFRGEFTKKLLMRVNGLWTGVHNCKSCLHMIRNMLFVNREVGEESIDVPKWRCTSSSEATSYTAVISPVPLWKVGGHRGQRGSKPPTSDFIPGYVCPIYLNVLHEALLFRLLYRPLWTDTAIASQQEVCWWWVCHDSYPSKEQKQNKSFRVSNMLCFCYSCIVLSVYTTHHHSMHENKFCLVRPSDKKKKKTHNEWRIVYRN